MSPQPGQAGGGLGPHGQSAANWLSQAGPSTNNTFPNTQQLPNGVQIPLSTLSQNPQVNAHPTLPHTLLQQHPPRSNTTPLQHVSNMGQNGIQPSPNMTAMANPASGNRTPQPTLTNGLSQPPVPGPSGPSQQPQRSGPARQLPALPREAFEAAYRQWCSKQNIREDEQLLHIEGKRIDLHRLHQEVIAAGTVHKVRL